MSRGCLLVIWIMARSKFNELFGTTLLAVLTVSSGAFSIFFCQVLMRTIFGINLSPPPKMKLYYDIIISFSFHFLYGAYISYGIFNGIIDTISLLW